MFRIGQSIDIHQLVKGRPLILGGITIESDTGLLGHSDADVLVHAIAEAILGALGEGDLGSHYSDSDPQYKDISSIIILKDVLNKMNEQGYELVNIDSLVMVENIILKDYKQNIKENLQNITGCQFINIKATRGEKLGFIGRGEGVCASAVVLLKKQED